MADGIAEAEILELPTEELADLVAYQLQLAWNEGETWGREALRRELDPVGHSKSILEALLKMKLMSDEERDTQAKIEANRIHKQKRRVMEQVLSWKSRGTG